MLEKKTSKIRLVLLAVISVSFIILSYIFINQYNQYKAIEERLNKAYDNTDKLSPRLYDIFSTFSQVDNLFRLYTVSFEKENFIAYQNKLDTLSQIISSIDSIPTEYNKSIKDKSHSILDASLTEAYVKLKKQVDSLIIFADENLSQYDEILNPNNKIILIKSDSVVNNILHDSLANTITHQDTLIKKKRNLIQRIFNAKNDTLLNVNRIDVWNSNQIDVIKKNIENLIRSSESTYNKSFTSLRNLYLESKEQERKLINSNYSLISDLKSSIDNIREIELQKVREAEKSDYKLYRLNTLKFRTYALSGLLVILIMLIFIIYYQSVVYKYERKLIKERKYASKLAEEKTNLLANISHEIRSPLNSLKGVIQLISQKEIHENFDDLLLNINYDISNINNTVNDILNLSKIESKTMQVVFDEVYISKIIDDTYNLHKYQAEQKGLKFINHNKINPILKISSNEFRLRQVISNLMSNAIKYTKKGSIRIFSRVDKGKILIDVIDTGIGIPKEKLDLVFRKYYTVDTDNTKIGFGLGLHISQLLAQQINGKLSVVSELDKGSTFSFEIPNSKIKKIKNTQKTVETLAKDTSIVIIDDNKINLLLARQTFKEYLNVSYFEDAQQALEFINKTKPDLVITDIIMPIMSGWEILEYIKNNTNLKMIKVIAHTAELTLLENKESKYTFDGVLDKNIDLEKLSKIFSN